MKALARILVIALAGGALTAGARYPWAYWPLAGIAAVLGMWALAKTGAFRSPNIRVLTAALALAAFAIALQIVPLPYDTFLKVQPAADKFLRTYQLTYAFTHPTQHAASIDPSATLVALGLFIAFGLLLIGLTSALPWMPVDWLLARMMTVGLIVALIGVIQRAAIGTTPAVYGFWRSTGGDSPFGPFFNRNHFAGWMVMVLPLALAYAAWIFEGVRWPKQRGVGDWIRWATTPDASRALLIGFCILAMAASVVITGSRSGITSMAVAVIVFGVCMTRRVASTMPRGLATLGLIALVGAAIFWAGTSATIARFSLTSTDLPGRLAAWRDTQRIIADFPWFGCGLGTYGLAMLVYQTGERTSIFVQAHNDYLQLLAEGGVLVSVAALVIVLVILTRIVRRFRDGDSDSLRYWARAGAVAGLAGIATQSVVEYSLQRPGNTALLVVLLALAMHRSLPRDRSA